MQAMSAFPDLLSEREQILCHLERGAAVTVVRADSGPQKRRIVVHRETMHVVVVADVEETAIAVSSIREVRKDCEHFSGFEQSSADARYYFDRRLSFVVVYDGGRAFEPLTLCCLAESEAEYARWVGGLNYLVEEFLAASVRTRREFFARRTFYDLKPTAREDDGLIGWNEFKAISKKIKRRIPKSDLKKVFRQQDKLNSGEIGFDDFSSIIEELLHDETSFVTLFKDYIRRQHGLSRIRSSALLEFLQAEQSECLGSTNAAEAMAKVVRVAGGDAVDQTIGDVGIVAFADYLFSEQNAIYVPSRCADSDMTRPLHHYFVSSWFDSCSSSLEGLARGLRRGVRAVQLNCTNGADGEPVLANAGSGEYRVSFADAVRTVKEHAFFKSPYPVILSVDDHCSPAQQRRMAAVLQVELGAALLTDALRSGPGGKTLPSPASLCGRVLLMHRKRKADGDADEDGYADYPTPAMARRQQQLVEEAKRAQRLQNQETIKQGTLYLKNPDSEVWQPYSVVLSSHNLRYFKSSSSSESRSGPPPLPQSPDGEGDYCLPASANRLDPEEAHVREAWFFGQLDREQSRRLLHEHAAFGDGTFLVRRSCEQQGEFTISFLRAEKVLNLRLNSTEKSGRRRYYLREADQFDSLTDLVEFYRKNPLPVQEEIKLKEPVPNQMDYEREAWYQPLVSRKEANDMLCPMLASGAFLVRRSDRFANSGFLVVSFVYQPGSVRHCLVKQEGRVFLVGRKCFGNLIDLVHFYMKHAIFKKARLNTPVNRQILDSEGIYIHTGSDKSDYYSNPENNPSLDTDPENCVRAIRDYRAESSRADVMSFDAGDVIVNVRRVSQRWWKGDLGARKGLLFPSDAVTDVQPQECVLDLRGASVVVHETATLAAARKDNDGPTWIIAIRSQHDIWVVKLGTTFHHDAMEWHGAIDKATTTNERRSAVAANIAPELSKLVVYCRAMVLNLQRPALYKEVAGVSESRLMSLIKSSSEEVNKLVTFTQKQLMRSYPRCHGGDFDPLPAWNIGVQMVAVNFHSPDRSTQLHSAMFLQNGECGYVLRPDSTFAPPVGSRQSKSSGRDASLFVRVLAGRFLGSNPASSASAAAVSPFVSVEVCEPNVKSRSKTKHVQRTAAVADNGFNPHWSDGAFHFYVSNAEMAFLKFDVYDERQLDDPGRSVAPASDASALLGQWAMPVAGLRQGFRSVPLRNQFNEVIFMAALLVEVRIARGQEIRISRQPEYSNA